MFLRILSLLALFVAGASAAATATSACAPGKVLENKKLTSPDGVTFTLTTSECKDVPKVQTRNFGGLDLLAGVNKRDPQECTHPEICVCGAGCNSVTCGASPAGTVKPADCQALTNAILTTLTGTFFISADTVHTANFQSCEYIFVNESDGEFEYCWDDFAVLSLSVSLDCPAQQAVCQGFGAAIFIAFA